MARDRLWLLVISLAILWPGTWRVSFVDRDEGWYAEVTREMLESGDWLVPRYLGDVWLHKPPLLYWCVAASWTGFGMGEATARLVSVLAMAGAVQFVMTLGRQIASRRAGWYAGIAFITAGLPAVIGKMLLTDSLLLLCSSAAFVLLWSMATDQVNWPRAAGFWACVGVAVLAKGPAVVLFVGALGLALLTLGGRRRWLIDPRLWLCIPVALVIAAPWYVFMSLKAGERFTGQFLMYEIVNRLRGTPHGHGGPPGYYLALSLAGLLPWTPLVPGTIVLAWKRRRTDRCLGVLLVWLIVPWLALELIHAKLPHYILPCYVPICLLLGREWASGTAWPEQHRRVHPLDPAERAALRLWVGVPVVLGAASIVTCIAWPGPWRMSGVAVAAALIIGFAVAARYQERGASQQSWKAAVAAMVVVHGLIGLWLLPSLEPFRFSRNVARAVNALAVPNDLILACGFEEPSMFFYIHNRAQAVSLHQMRTALHEQHKDRIVVMGKEEFDALPLRLRNACTWEHVDGFNYVHMERATVAIGRPALTTPRLATGGARLPHPRTGDRAALARPSPTLDPRKR